MLRKKFSNLTRRATLIGLNLKDQRNGTSHTFGQFLLCQIKGLAATPNPGSETILNACHFLIPAYQKFSELHRPENFPEHCVQLFVIHAPKVSRATLHA